MEERREEEKIKCVRSQGEDREVKGEGEVKSIQRNGAGDKEVQEAQEDRKKTFK